MYNANVDYSGMATWGMPQTQQASVPQVPIYSGLRGWEMNQPGLVSGSGGLPYGTGDYAGSPGITAQVAAPQGKGIFDGFFNTQRQDPNTGAVLTDQGWGGTALGAANGIFNAWMGMKQYGLAKDALASSKQQFNLNYDAQRTTTNAQLRDRQAARVASNPGAYQSVGDYMTANSIGPR